MFHRVLCILTLASAAALTARSAAAEPIGEVKALLDCRQVADRDARLSCFDNRAATLGQAIDRQDLLVFDQPTIRKARRSIFGLSLPNLDGMLGHEGGDDKRGKVAVGDTDEHIEATIAAASRDPYGRWAITLDDGARWIQIDERDLARDPAKGKSIRIRRAAMGSYFANVDGQIAIRMRRER